MARSKQLSRNDTNRYNQQLDQATRLHKAGRVRQALGLYRELVQHYPKQPAGLIACASAERAIGRFDEAVKHFVAAEKLGQHDARLYNDLAGCYAMTARFADAQRALDKAIKLSPDAVTLRASKAEFHTWAGEHEQSQGVLKQIIDAGEHDHPSVAQAMGAEAVAMGQQDLAVELLTRYSSDGRIAPNDQSNLLFRLVKLLQASGDEAGAWDAADRANTLRRLPFDSDAHNKGIDQIITNWPKETTSRLPKAANGQTPSGSLPVFILGMPRSGTSLLEQMLDRSGQVHAGGELQIFPHAIAELTQAPVGGGQTGEVKLDQKRVDRVGAKLIEHYRRLVPASKRGAVRVTDKLPWNFSHLGMISRFLPGAKIIHCTRDPMDTCVSIYMNSFMGESNFAADLATLGGYYRAYRRLMDHWKSALEIEILDVAYEDVVRDPETQLKRVCEFLGIDFDPAMLSPHESKRVVMTASQQQIREPINDRSIGRAKTHEAHLGALREALGDLAAG